MRETEGYRGMLEWIISVIFSAKKNSKDILRTPETYINLLKKSIICTICTDALRPRDISFAVFSSFEYHAVILKCQVPSLAVIVY